MGSVRVESARGVSQRLLALPVADRLRLFILALSLPLVSWFAWEASYASEQWVLLVRELPAPKIAEVAKYLEGRRIPFEVKGGGHDLWVPAGLSAELTIEMDKHITGVTR